MLRIAICDDNTSICSTIEKIILEYAKVNNIKTDVEVFNTGESIINYIKTEHSFDLIFLDIELEGLTGVGVGKVIRNEFRDHISKIIFISGVEGYEMELFNLQPLNFLKKPIDKKKIFNCVDLLIEISGVTNSYFEYKFNYEIKKVPYKEVIYFESFLKKVKIVTVKSEDEIYGSLENIKKTLPKIFISPHKSYIVNFSNVINIKNGQLIMSNGHNVSISQRNVKNIRNLQLEIEKEKSDARL